MTVERKKTSISIGRNFAQIQARGGQPSASSSRGDVREVSAVAMVGGGGAWSATMFRWVVCVKGTSTWMPGQKVCH